MKCPFCNLKLTMSDSEHYASYYCYNSDCLIKGEMPRFIVKYEHVSQKPLYKEFYLGDFYIKVDFVTNTTFIYKLSVIFLYDGILIQKALDLDLNNKQSIINKIQTLVTFS